jgi:translation initiation factor 1
MAARIVYSTGSAACAPIAGGRCASACVPKARRELGKPTAVRVGRETKGRAGRGVTTVSGLRLPEAQLAELAAKLKKRCGSGGTLREGVIEIQGEHRDTIVAELLKMGWQAKKSGG